MENKKKKTKLLAIRLTDEEHSGFKTFCASRGVSMTSYVVEAMNKKMEIDSLEEIKPTP